MRRSINPGLGAALVLVLFTLAVHFSSCGQNNSNGAVPATHLTKPVILFSHDSSGGKGSSPGNPPKVIVVSCPLNDCALKLSSYAPAAGSDSAEFGLELNTTEAIPANTTIRLEIKAPSDPKHSAADSAMKK